MEIIKCYFTFLTIVLTLMCTETAGYRAGRIRQELSHIREDISALFEKTDQLNISVVESCGPCVSGNTSYPTVTKHNGRQEMVKVNNNNVLLKYRSLINAFVSEKKINRDLQHQLRSMEDNFSAIEKVAKENTRHQQSMEASISAIEKIVNTKDRNQRSQLQVMEARISTIEKKANDGYEELLSRLQSMENSISAANERDRELQSRLRSLEESIEDKISNMFRNIRNDMISFMTTVSNAETTSVKSDITTSPIYRDLRNDMISVMTTVSNAETTSVKSDITTSPIIHTNCKTVPESGVYTLHLEFIMSPVNVYCDQETDGGGWIVSMRRQDGSVNFIRSWLDYKHGFGSPDGEFWAGNELLFKLTKDRPMQMRIDMEDFDGNTAFAMYEEFQIGTETDKYRLYVSAYSGTAGDSLIETSSSDTQHVGMQFSTFDSDNDKSIDNCAELYKSGWWYYKCFDANLNAPYSHDKTVPWYKGIIWYSWKGWKESLKRVEMKIR